MKPKFHNIPSPFGLVPFAGAFTFVSRLHWEMQGKKALIRAAWLVFAAIVSGGTKVVES
jgi:hypothetical protein